MRVGRLFSYSVSRPPVVRAEPAPVRTRDEGLTIVRARDGLFGALAFDFFSIFSDDSEELIPGDGDSPPPSVDGFSGSGTTGIGGASTPIEAPPCFVIFGTMPPSELDLLTLQGACRSRVE